MQWLIACSISASSRAMLRTIASVLSGLGRRGIRIGSTLPRLPTIGGDIYFAIQQQAGFLFVVGPGEGAHLTAPDGPAVPAQAQPRTLNSQGSTRPRAVVKRRLWHRCGWWTSHRQLFTSLSALAQVPTDRADAGSATSQGGSRERRWDHAAAGWDSYRACDRGNHPCRRRLLAKLLDLQSSISLRMC